MKFIFNEVHYGVELCSKHVQRFRIQWNSFFNEVHHEVELYLKHAQQSRENERDEVIAETFVEDEHRLQAAGPLCAALVYSHSLILNQICLAIGDHWEEYFHHTFYGYVRVRSFQPLRTGELAGSKIDILNFCFFVLRLRRSFLEASSRCISAAVVTAIVACCWERKRRLEACNLSRPSLNWTCFPYAFYVRHVSSNVYFYFSLFFPIFFCVNLFGVRAESNVLG